MLLTKPQLNRFFREWSRLVRFHQWGPVEAETQRHALLQRCGFASLTQVDRAAGFDRVLAQLGFLADNLAATAEAIAYESGPADPGLRRRYLHKIFQHAQAITHSDRQQNNNYLLAIAHDKFHLTEGLRSLEDLSDDQLKQLLMTLAARRSAHARRACVEADAAGTTEEAVAPF